VDGYPSGVAPAVHGPGSPVGSQSRNMRIQAPRRKIDERARHGDRVKKYVTNR
jgi:hypothetical protein